MKYRLSRNCNSTALIKAKPLPLSFTSNYNFDLSINSSGCYSDVDDSGNLSDVIIPGGSIEVELESADWNSSALATIIFDSPSTIPEHPWSIVIQIALLRNISAAGSMSFDQKRTLGSSWNQKDQEPRKCLLQFQAPIAEFQLDASVTGIRLWIIDKESAEDTSRHTSTHEKDGDTGSDLDTVQLRLFIRPGNQTGSETADISLPPAPTSDHPDISTPAAILNLQKRETITVDNSSQSNITCIQPTDQLVSPLCIDNVKYPISSGKTTDEIQSLNATVQQYWSQFSDMMNGFDCRISDSVAAYSPVCRCSECLTSYKDWLCGLYYPRCSSDDTFAYSDTCSTLLCYKVIQNCPYYGFSCPSLVDTNGESMILAQLSGDYCMGRVNQATISSAAIDRRGFSESTPAITLLILVITLLIMN